MSGSAVLDKLFAAMQGSKGIPAMEGIVTSVLGTLNDPQGSSRLLAHYISEDFALTQKVLKLANSPMYAPFAKEVGSISAAVKVLGTDVLTHVVLSTGVATPAEINEDKTLAKTLMASELARALCPDRSEAVSVAGLLYDMGSLLVDRFLPQEAEQIQTQVAAGHDADQAARAVLGLSFQQLGAQVARRWKLPPALVSLIEGLGEPELVEVARFSNSASVLILDGKGAEVDRLIAELELPNLDKTALNGLIQRKLERHPAPAAPAATAAAASAAAPAAAPPATPAVMALEDLHRKLAGMPWKTVDDLASAMFAGISRILQASHVLLFMRLRSGDFAIRYGYGRHSSELRARFRISGAYRPTAFHAVVKNNVDISIADITRLKPSALPEDYHALFAETGRFVILPIARGGAGVSGMVYCDWASAAAHSETELVALKKLRDLFLPFFSA